MEELTFSAIGFLSMCVVGVGFSDLPKKKSFILPLSHIKISIQRVILKNGYIYSYIASLLINSKEVCCQMALKSVQFLFLHAEISVCHLIVHINLLSNVLMILS